MAAEQAALTKGPQEGSLKWLLQQPGYKDRFNAMLGTRAPQFMASIINIASAKNFQRVEPKSILAAAAVAATLDLPIDKNLGFAWIIPYGNLAQFQIGYKGVVQLALRSGQYAGMNAFKVNDGALGGYDAIGDPVILWEKLDKTQPAVGYAFAWRLVNGFCKIVYWTKEEVEAHAKRYSQAFKANKRDSPWFTDFDKMALKTLIMNALRTWGILSVEMRQAVQLDQSAAIDIEATPVYPDNDADAGEEEAAEGTNRAEYLADKLKAERKAAETPAPEPAVEADSAPDEFRPALSRYRDAFAGATEAIGRNKAQAAVWTVFETPSDEATDEQLDAAAKALNEAVSKEAATERKKK